ncbi:MAG: hypothetical protein KAX49_15705 [Halanaerobiales bacterium]|nr:hypothetical protein [Halanaerobiales bacterium]
MELNVKREISISFRVLCILLAILGLGWLVASYLLAEISLSNFTNVLSRLGTEIFGAIFIGFFLGIIIDIYVKRIIGDTPGEMLRKNNIKEIYFARTDAQTEFKEIIKNPKIKNVFLIGISLRDFLGGGGKLLGIWRMIEKRLREEEKGDFPEKDRLHVKLLLLDPRSSEGNFRRNVEKSTIGLEGLDQDVNWGLNEVYRLQEEVYNGQQQDFLEVRLYEHCSFSFIFATDSELYIEQYSYRNHKKSNPLPLIKYETGNPQYQELFDSVNIIWDHAELEKISPYSVSTSSALEEAQIKNIYRRAERTLLSQREHECIKLTKPGEEIKILAITGKFFISHPVFEALRIKACPPEKIEPVNIKYALLNPISQQAILRAIADNYPATEITKALTEWSWEKHKESRLYLDIHMVIDEISRWKEKGCSFEIHLCSGIISCFLILTPTAAFVEQYFYGRSKRYEEGNVLGGEFPVFEYKMLNSAVDNTIEQEVLSSHFKVIWDAYSIDVKDYNKNYEEKAFEESLIKLRAEVNQVNFSNNNSKTV